VPDILGPRQLSHQENRILIAELTYKEVHDAIMQMEKNKAPGPDGFPTEFYQFFGYAKR
jgi:hypothetical protein